ncbi:unnamed protein product [Heligmosomoides polygyrus]|uniref:NR LBD domain-containing protein n=1 Tax=Heligmosomoides polygyrus TaxID=6339 RepID=A0A183F9G7_HELPZ|nr:unnamed protein product [Heligmosomoides polygyrus]
MGNTFAVSDLSVDIGVPLKESYRVARVTTPSLWEFLRDCIKNPKLIAMLAIMYARMDEIIWRMRDNTKWLMINYVGISRFTLSEGCGKLSIKIFGHSDCRIALP